MARVDEAFQALMSDHESGSSDILKKTVEWLRESLDKGRIISEIRADLAALSKAHPSMGLLHNFSLSFAKEELNRANIDFWMETYHEHESSACREFSMQLSHFTNVLIHSYSGLLYESLKNVPNTLNIFCTESRPVYEGRSFAEKLSDTHHKIYLITDMAAFAVIPRVEIMAFGCDSITPRGIINKIGTAALAQIAQRQGRMNYFVGTTEKVLNKWDDSFLMRQGPRDEIYKGSRAVQVENYYFDLTPPAYIDGVVLESGLARIY